MVYHYVEPYQGVPFVDPNLNYNQKLLMNHIRQFKIYGWAAELISPLYLMRKYEDRCAVTSGEEIEAAYSVLKHMARIDPKQLHACVKVVLTSVYGELVDLWGPSRGWYLVRNAQDAQHVIDRGCSVQLGWQKGIAMADCKIASGGAFRPRSKADRIAFEDVHEAVGNVNDSLQDISERAALRKRIYRHARSLEYAVAGVHKSVPGLTQQDLITKAEAALKAARRVLSDGKK